MQQSSCGTAHPFIDRNFTASYVHININTTFRNCQPRLTWISRNVYKLIFGSFYPRWATISNHAWSKHHSVKKCVLVRTAQNRKSLIREFHGRKLLICATLLTRYHHCCCSLKNYSCPFRVTSSLWVAVHFSSSVGNTNATRLHASEKPAEQLTQPAAQSLNDTVKIASFQRRNPTHFFLTENSKKPLQCYKDHSKIEYSTCRLKEQLCINSNSKFVSVNTLVWRTPVSKMFQLPDLPDVNRNIWSLQCTLLLFSKMPPFVFTAESQHERKMGNCHCTRDQYTW